MSSSNTKRSIQEGEDADVSNPDDLPYRFIKRLGKGQHGYVEKVEDENTGKVLARKTYQFGWGTSKKALESIWRNEAAMIRGCRGHRHIIRVYATYLAERELGILLHPVADGGSLNQYLAKYVDKKEKLREGTGNQRILEQEIEDMTIVLKQAFGCLARGLAFIHEQLFRHKDVKPANILVHQGRILYTDFGLSQDYSALERTTTDGLPGPKTPKYAAPEVLADPPEPRNSASDVWSLACIFIELISAMTSLINTSGEFRYATDMPRLHLEISQSDLVAPLQFLKEMIVKMTGRDLSSRPKAFELFAELLQHPGFYCEECLEGGIPSGRIVKVAHDFQAATSASGPEKLNLGFSEQSNIDGSQHLSPAHALVPPEFQARLQRLHRQRSSRSAVSNEP